MPPRCFHGKAEKSVEADVRAIRSCDDFFDRCSDDFPAENLQTYFVALLKSYSRSTVKLDRCGLQFIFRYRLKWLLDKFLSTKMYAVHAEIERMLVAVDGHLH